MTLTLPIQAVDAVVRIAELPGMQVVHAPADENSDVLALLCLLEAVELRWRQCRKEGRAGSIVGGVKPAIGHAHPVTGALARLERARVIDDDEPVRDLKLTFSHIDTHVDGDYAWTVCDVESEAWLPEQDSLVRDGGRETFAFHRERDRWRALPV